MGGCFIATLNQCTGYDTRLETIAYKIMRSRCGDRVEGEF